MRALTRTLLMAISTTCWPAVAMAQAGPPANAPQNSEQLDSGQIEEIVVTAQRRSESAQSVPISLQSFSAESLDEKGVSSTEDLTNVVGGLIIQPTAARPMLFLRGVGNNSSNTTPSVLTFVDGVYYPFGQATDLENIERIEVLKGPQGTLFGRNATGGVIQIITKPPSETPGARVELGYGNYQAIDASAYVTGGLAGGVAMDLAVRYRNRDKGFGTNIATGEDWYTDHRVSLRSRLRAELSDATTLTLAGDYSSVEQDVGDHFVPAFGHGFLFVDGARRNLGGSYFPGDYDANSGATPPLNKAHEWGGSLTFETALAGLTLRNITAYRRGSERLIIDSDGGPTDSVEIMVHRSPRTSFTQELQLLSDDGGAFQWVAGVFYYRGKAVMNPFGFFGTGAEAIFGLPRGGTITAHAKDIADSIAGYAQGTYEILPDTKLTIGGRYTIETRKITGEVRRSDILVPGRSGTLSQKAKEPTWRVALDHSFSPGMMIYASVSRGFNSGFYNQSNIGGFASEAQNPRVEPEFLTAYEIGTKLDLLGRRLRVNLSAFKYDYKGLQQQIYEFGATKTINAGASEIKGIDFEIVARPVPSLTLSVSGTYLDAHYKSYLLAPNYVLQPSGAIIVDPVNPSLDAAGKKTTNTPEISYTASVSHVLSTSVGRFTTSGNVNYRGKSFVDPQNRFNLPTRYVVNLTERWTSPDDHYFISLWAKNLLDKRYDYAITLVTPAGLVGSRAEPRTYGVSAGFDF